MYSGAIGRRDRVFRVDRFRIVFRQPHSSRSTLHIDDLIELDDRQELFGRKHRRHQKAARTGGVDRPSQLLDSVGDGGFLGETAFSHQLAVSGVGPQPGRPEAVRS